MTKKFFSFLLVLSLVCSFTSCDNSESVATPVSTIEESPTPSAPNQETPVGTGTPTQESTFPAIPTPYEVHPKDTDTLVNTITFRRGDDLDGETLFTGDSLEEVYVSYDALDGAAMLHFIFTEKAKETLYDYSSELSQTNESLSIWIADERICSAKLMQPIDDGQFTLLSDSSMERAMELYNKFYGIQA